MPAFALGRAQEVLLILRKAVSRSKNKQVAVFADGQALAGLAASLKPKAAALVHGDRDARERLAALMGEQGLWDIYLPSTGAA